eukprot:5215064-Pleurochrysis_carterae.AAC.1
MSKVFKRWKFMTGLGIKDDKEGREGNKGPEERKERTYGMNYWGRRKALPRSHIKVKRFLQTGVG